MVDDDECGLTGGLLLVNARARPLEFHCTVPVKANRAQQILYGATLLPYLYGEQIGRALLAKANPPPQILLTDAAPALALRELIAVPMACVCAADHQPPTALEESAGQFCLGRWRLEVAQGTAGDREILQTALAALGSFDLMEPFGRIREAIEETQRAARRSEQSPRLSDAA